MYAYVRKPEIHMKQIRMAFPGVEREKELNRRNKREKEKRKRKKDMPKEAGSNISKRRKNESCMPGIASVSCLWNVQEVRISKVDFNRICKILCERRPPIDFIYSYYENESCSKTQSPKMWGKNV